MSRTLGTYALKFPIIRETKVEGVVNEEELRPAGFCVVLKRPRAKDLQIMDRFEGQEIAGSIALIARISNLSLDEVELLDGEDLGDLGKLLDKRQQDGPKTGETA